MISKKEPDFAACYDLANFPLSFRFIKFYPGGNKK